MTAVLGTIGKRSNILAWGSDRAEGSVLCRQRNAAKLVEEVEDEDDFVLAILGPTFGRHGDGHSLAVRMKVQYP